MCYNIIMITLKNVYLTQRQEFHTLFNLNLEIKKNTIFISNDYLSSSSLLRIIAKIIPPTSGEVLIDNKNIKTIKNRDLNLSFIPKEDCLFNNKSIYKNLAFPLKIRKINKNLIKNEVFLLFFKYNLQNFIISNLKNKKIINRLNKISTIKEREYFILNNIKVKHFSFEFKKVLMLLRSIIWNPKIVLLENFMDSIILREDIKLLASDIINDYKINSLIIASESENFDCYNTFDNIIFDYGKIVK